MFVKEKCIYLGKITRTHGIHGQLVLMSDLPLDTANTKEPILVNIDGGLVPFYLHKGDDGLRYRDHQSYLIHFDHIDTKDSAEKYCGCETYLLSFPIKNIDDATLTPELFRGFSIYNENEEFVGTIEEIVNYSGNTLACILIDEKEVLIPFTDSHIIAWDIDKHRIQLQIADGLLEI